MKFWFIEQLIYYGKKIRFDKKSFNDAMDEQKESLLNKYGLILLTNLAKRNLLVMKMKKISTISSKNELFDSAQEEEKVTFILDEITANLVVKWGHIKEKDALQNLTTLFVNLYSKSINQKLLKYWKCD